MAIHRALTRGVALLGATAILTFACTGPQSTASPAPNAPIAVEQSSAPAVPKAGGSPAPGLPNPAPGPNLLAKNWSERLGVLVSELKPASGKPLINPKPGDLYFFSNSSTAWGATNTKNGVWVIDAKTKKTVLNVAPFDGEKNSSHGLAVSGDGRFIYLPMLGADSHIDVLDGRTFEVVQTIKTLGRPHHWKLWQDPTTRKDYIIGEDFNWNFTGSGFYVIDPSQSNAVVGGLSNGDFQGNPYVSTPAPDGKFIYMTVPAPIPAVRDKMDGYFGKIDPKTWKVVAITPMIDPLWAEISLDGKYAYVTSGGEARVYKVNTQTMKEEGEVQTGPGPWGARISYDQTKLYTADKGEGPGYNQQGRTSTIIDLQTMGVLGVVPIGLTTDHVILSPDGSEVWFTSNADHSIVIYDTKTDTLKATLKDPVDGDIHGGVFVQYRNDGKGGVIGEVVADYSGLHGTALATQAEYVAAPALTIAIDRNGFANKTLTAPTGQNLRVTLKYVSGTGGGKVTFESEAMGIKSITLDPGKSTEFRWTAPAQPTDVKAKVNKTNADLTIKVATPVVATPAPGATGPREIFLSSKNFIFEQKAIEVKAGETVKMTFTNGDDEKHNFVSIGGGNLLSPDIAGGAKGSFTYTAPSSVGTFKVLCAYHPTMTLDLVIK